MNNEYKLIDYRLFEPHKSLFKSSKKEKSEFKKVLCCNSENCQAFKDNKCTFWSGLYGHKCPYGKKIHETGFTQRARNYYKWISDKQESVKHIKQLSQQKGLCKIGEYIYFPYPHWSLDRNIPLEENERSGIFNDGIMFIHEKRFSIELIEKIINAIPMALMGGIIDSYQKEVVPKIVNHIRERLPELFEIWHTNYPDTYKRFEQINYVGRIAKLITLKPNCFLKENHLWNGKKILIENWSSSFLPYKGVANLELIPDENQSFTITDNNQVYEKTEFFE